MDYNSFNSLYTATITLTAAYIFIGNAKEIVDEKFSGLSFFDLLNSMSTSLSRWALLWIDTAKRKDDKITNMINVIRKGVVKIPLFARVLTHVENKIGKDKVKLETIVKSTKTMMNKQTSVWYMNVVSFDCFMYALLLIYIGAVSDNVLTSKDGCCFILDVLMIFFTCHCVVSDILHYEGHFRPTIWLHGFLFVATLIFAIFIGHHLNDTLEKCAVVLISASMCFIGFLVYFLKSLISCLLLSFSVQVRVLWIIFCAYMCGMVVSLIKWIYSLVVRIAQKWIISNIKIEEKDT